MLWVEVCRPMAGMVEEARGRSKGGQRERSRCYGRGGGNSQTRSQRGFDEPEVCPTSPHWSWARLLQRVFAFDMATCPFCQRGVLRLIAVITQGEVIHKIL